MLKTRGFEGYCIMEFSKRLDLFGDEIFAALNERKAALEAQGRTIYNLSAGTPDFAPAEHIRKAMMDAAAAPQHRKYRLRDTPEMLDAVCGYYKRRFGVEITPEIIYDYVDASGQLPRTSAVNVFDYVREFRHWRQQGYSIVRFCVSSDFSSSYQNACIAAQEFTNVYPVDSRNLSTGIGHLVLDAAEMAEQGMDAADIASALEKKREKLDVSFVLDTLEYLKRGGRCSALVAMSANLQHLKPCIEVKDGKMGVGH